MRGAGILLILSVCLWPPAPADLLREVEPNDGPVSAQAILPIVSVGGVISQAGDRDLFSIRLDPGAVLKADILARGFRAGTQPGSSLSARLRILDTDGVTVLAEEVSMGSFDDPTVEAQVFAEGEYFVSVEDQNGTGSPAHTYVLSIEVDDNDSIATATKIHPPELLSIDALIWPAGDLDFYSFDGHAGQIVTLDLASAVFNPGVPPIKGVMTLYRPDASVLASASYATSSQDPFIQTALPVTGTYSIEVRELRSFVGGTNSYYQLSVELGPATSNNSIATASPVVQPRGVSGTLCPSADTDFYSFTLPAAATLLADLDARESLLSLMTGASLSAFSSGGTLLGSNSSTPDPTLSVAVPPGSLDVVVSGTGTSSGLCDDAYYKLWLDADLDGDGVRLPHDVCPGVFDPGQADGDYDGVGDACDDCIAVFNPGQEGDLRTQEPVGETLAFTGGGSGASLAWTPAAGSVASNVYRAAGTKSGIALSFTCLADNVPGAALLDPAVPPPGSVFYYVVTGENCGESGAGTDTSGQERLIARCPQPI
jgi:hypothetical protein